MPALVVNIAVSLCSKLFAPCLNSYDFVKKGNLFFSFRQFSHFPFHPGDRPQSISIQQSRKELPGKFDFDFSSSPELH